MQMNWDAIGAIGEIVGAVAVVATLIFLALQIRQNTASVRQQCYNDITVRQQEWFRPLFEDRDVTRMYWQGMNGEKMEEVDAVRFVALWMVVLRHVEDCFVQYRKGIVERDVWERESRTLAAALSRPSFLQLWKELQQYFLQEFIAEVARLKPIPIVVYDPATGSYERSGAEGSSEVAEPARGDTP
jgi:hypothetical protein